jgi:PDZ domain
MAYDERGSEVEEAFFGLGGKPALSNDGFARATLRHDERGNMVEVAYFGLDGKPTLLKDGYARIAMAYNERGNKVEEAFFGLDGKSATGKDGVGRMTMAYDERGNEVESEYFSVDDQGRDVVATLRDADGQVVLIDDIGDKVKYSYADGDQPIAVTYLDEHDKIIPVEVEVNEIVADSVAARLGLAPGDRLLSYAGEKLRSIQQLIFLTGKAGADARKLVYRRGKKTVTIDVPPGRLGTGVINVRAAAPSKRR